MKFTEVLQGIIDSGPIVLYSYDGTRLLFWNGNWLPFYQ